MRRLNSLCALTAGLLMAAAGASPAHGQVPYSVTHGQVPYQAFGGGTVHNPVAYGAFPAWDEGAAEIPLPFTFSWFGVDYTTVYAYTNGFLSFQAPNTMGILAPPRIVPSPSNPLHAFIGVIWQDLVGGTNPAIRSRVTGMVGSRVIEIQYENLERNGSPMGLTGANFQVRLYEGTSSVEIVYGPNFGIVGATAALENADGTDGVNFMAASATCTGNCPCFPRQCASINFGGAGGRTVFIELPNQAEVQGRVRAPPGAFAGSSFDVGLDVINAGLGDAGPFDYEVRLSSSDTSTAGSVLLGSYSVPAGLPGVDALSATVTLTVPGGTPIGEYYVALVVDPTDLVAEVDEGNNITYSGVFRTGPELNATLTGPSQTGPGEPFDVQLDLQTSGAPVAAPVQVQFYLSPNPTLDGSAIPVPPAPSVTLPDGFSTSRTITLTTPAGVAPSPPSYYVLAQIDPADAIAETDEGNNVAASAATLDVRGPDLEVTGFDSGPFGFRGQPYPVTAVITNSGAATATDFTLCFLLSDNPVISVVSDTQIASTGPITLAPGDSQTVRLEPELPAATTLGPWYVGAFVDCGEVVLEAVETNNSLRREDPITVIDPAPDLSPLAVSTASSAAAGQSIPVSVEVGNLGTAPGTAHVRVVISDNPGVTAQDPTLYETTTPVTVAPTEQATVSAWVELPTTIASGTYYIGAIVDPADQVAEVLEDNNRRAVGPVTISGVDLAVVSPTPPFPVIGNPYAWRFAAAGGTGRYQWTATWSDGAPPPGLSFDPALAELSGTPLGEGEGAHTLTLQVTSGDLSIEVQYDLLVVPPSLPLTVVTTRLPPAVASEQYSVQLLAAGGTPPYEWSLGSPGPAGVGLASDGVLGGEPQLVGPSTFNVVVRDQLGQRASGWLALDVVDPSSTITISTPAVPSGVVGESYQTAFNATGGEPPYLWTLEGDLPPGIVFMASTAQLTGTPTVAGEYEVFVEVRDSGGLLDRNAYLFEIYEEGALRIVTGSTDDDGLPGATLGEPYLTRDGEGVQLVATPPEGVRWTLVNGALPPGIDLNPETGALSGTPTSAGAYAFTVLALNEANDLRRRALVIVVEDPAITMPTPDPGGCTNAGPSSGVAFALFGLLGLLRRRRRGAAAAAGVLLGLLVTGGAFAQTSTPYVRTQYSQPYASTMGGTTVPFFGVDDSTAQIPIGFTFRYYGVDYTQVYVGTNGAMSFTGSFISTGPSGVPAIPNDALFEPDAVIAPFWDDLYISAGAVTYSLVGAAPNRELIVQWENVGHYTGGTQSQSRLNMQVKLSEASGAVRLQYGAFSRVASEDSLWAGAIGIENETGTLGEVGLPCGLDRSCGASTLIALQDQVIEFSAPSGVELVGSGAAPTGGNPGDPIAIGVTARNIGALTATTAFAVDVYFSTDATIDTTDTLLGRGTISTPIAPRGSATATITSTVPAAAPGFYFIGAIIDADDDVAETVEANNTALLTNRFLVGADLAVEVDTPAGSGPGEAIDVTVRVLNLGAAQAAVPLRVLYSADQIPDAQDAVVATATVAVPAAPSTAFPIPVVIPNLVPGDYYVIAEVDPSDVIAEADETNNVGVSAAITEIQGPDLTADAVDAGGDFAFRGGMLEVSGTLGNEGLATGTDFFYGFYLSDNQLCSVVSDPLLQEFGPVTLGPQQTSDVSHVVPVPANLPGVPHYVCLVVNNRSTVLEGNQNNNIARTMRTLDVRDPQADFAVTEVRLPPRAAAGESVTLQRSLLNAGNATGSVDYEVYVSADPTLDRMQDTLLGGETVSLAPGAEDIGVDVLPIPTALAPGAYYIIYVVDPDDQVAELYEDNNTLASGGTLVVLPSDLVILTEGLPLATVNVAYDVYLAAQGGAGALTWALTQGALPDGLSLDAATGRLSGTPGEVASVQLTFSVTDGAITAQRTFGLIVASRSTPLEIATHALPAGFVGRNYAYPLTAFGGVAPYTWQMSSRDPLPPGLVFSAEGRFDGVPTATGLVQVNLRVTDATGEFAERPLVVRVVEPGDAVRLSNDVLPDGRLGEMYDETLRVASGTGSSPFTFSFAGGELPPGLSLEADRLFGTPERVGLFAFSARVQDSRLDYDVNTYIVEIVEGRDGVSFVSNALPRGRVNEPYLDEGQPVVVRAVSGADSATVAVSILSGELPPGLSMAADGTVSGTPSSSGTFSFLVLAADGVGQTDVRAYGIVVDEPAEVTPPDPGDSGGCRCVEDSGSGWAWAWLPLLGLLAFGRRRGLLAGLLAVAVLAPRVASSQTQVPYFVDTRTEPYVELSGGTAITFPFSNDDDDAAVTLPFPFRFYETDYTTVNVGTNGLLAFGGSAVSLSNTSFPTPGTPNNLIAPWWTDLITTAASTHEMGTAPNRVFIVQYEQVSAYSGAPGSPKFQVWFYEGSAGRFEVRYGDPGTTGSGWFASAGWENAQGTEGGDLLPCASSSCDGADLSAARDRVVRVQQDGGPDLAAVGVDVPAVVYAGVPFDVDVQIGSLHQNSLGPVRFAVHLMGPGDVTPNNPIFTSGPTTVSPYQQLTVTATPSVPLSTPNGRYRLALVVDTLGELTEPDEANNVFVSTDTLRLAPVQPDFIVPAVESSATALSPGESFEATVYLRNRGNDAGRASWRLVLSRNQVVSPEDIELASDAVDLPLLSTATVTVNVQAPSDTPAGRYYLGAVIDPLNAVAEIDEVNNTGLSAAPIAISSSAVQVSTQALPGGYVGIDYTHFLRARGGDGAFTWSIVSGDLPAGLNLIPNRGELRGQPSMVEDATFTVQVQSAGETATAQLTLSVAEPDGGLSIVTQNLLPGLVGAAYPPAEAGAPAQMQQRLQALGNQGEVTFSVDGTLPAGLDLDPDGYLHGSPVQAGVFDIRVIATDDVGEARRTLPLTIGEPGRLTLVAARLPDGRVGDDYDFALRVIGRSRTATVTFTEQGPLPPGIVVADSGRIVGIPQQVGTWTFNVEASEGNGALAAKDSATFRLTVSSDGGFEIVERSLPPATLGELYAAGLRTRGGVAPLVWRVMGPPLPRGITFEVEMAPGEPSYLNFIGIPQVQDVVSVLVTVTDGAGRYAERAFTIDVREPEVEVTPPVVDDGCACVRTRSAPGGGLLLAFGLLWAVRRRR